MNFKENFIKLLNEKGINQSQLANKIGVSRGVITDYKNGKILPSFETLEKIKNALNFSYDDLLEDKKQEKK